MINTIGELSKTLEQKRILCDEARTYLNQFAEDDGIEVAIDQLPMLHHGWIWRVLCFKQSLSDHQRVSLAIYTEFTEHHITVEFNQIARQYFLEHPAFDLPDSHLSKVYLDHWNSFKARIRTDLIGFVRFME